MIDTFKSIGKIQMEFTEKISRLGNLAKELIPKIELPKLIMMSLVK